MAITVVQSFNKAPMNRSIEPWFLAAFVRRILVLTKECSESGEGEVLNVMPWSYLVMSCACDGCWECDFMFQGKPTWFLLLTWFLPLKQGISCTFFLQPIQCKHLVNPRVPRLLSLQEQSLFSLTGMVRIRGIIAGMGLISGYVVKYSNLPRLYAYHCISMYDYMYDCKKHIKAEIDRLTQKGWW